jgi:hypothetical protein
MSADNARHDDEAGTPGVGQGEEPAEIGARVVLGEDDVLLLGPGQPVRTLRARGGGRPALHSPRGVGTTMQVTMPLTAPDAAGSAVVVIGRPDDIGRDLAAGPEPWAPARGS